MSAIEEDTSSIFLLKPNHSLKKQHL